MRKSVSFECKLRPGDLAVSVELGTLWMSLLLDPSHDFTFKEPMLMTGSGAVFTIISIVRRSKFSDDNPRDDAIVWDPSNEKLGRLSLLVLMKV